MGRTAKSSSKVSLRPISLHRISSISLTYIDIVTYAYTVSDTVVKNINVSINSVNVSIDIFNIGFNVRNFERHRKV